MMEKSSETERCIFIAMINMFSRHGCLEELLPNRVSTFLSAVLENFLKRMGEESMQQHHPPGVVSNCRAL